MVKALSLKQPWAELILQGKKTIELRKWNTKFRGEFYIHASKIPDKEQMEKYGFASLPTGRIVGKANLVDVIEYTSLKEFLRDIHKHCASKMIFGKYGFVLENIQRIEQIPYKGQLNFFEVNI